MRNLPEDLTYLKRRISQLPVRKKIITYQSNNAHERARFQAGKTFCRESRQFFTRLRAFAALRAGGGGGDELPAKASYIRRNAARLTTRALLDNNPRLWRAIIRSAAVFYPKFWRNVYPKRRAARAPLLARPPYYDVIRDNHVTSTRRWDAAYSWNVIKSVIIQRKMFLYLNICVRFNICSTKKILFFIQNIIS